jgi:hypothetical protein
MSTNRNGRTAVVLRWLIFVILLVIIAGAILIWRPAIEPITPPARKSFDANLVQRGARLSAVGSCATCHTSNETTPYSGGLALATPFGTIYSTNITPDAKTGIGCRAL